MQETNTRFLYINRLIDKMNSNISLWSIFDANKLTGPNVLYCYWNLRIVSNKKESCKTP